MKYLGSWVTCDGVKPIYRKIEAITNMKPPNSQKGLQQFKGGVHYYRNMWPRQSYTLSPLTILMSIKSKFTGIKI